MYEIFHIVNQNSQYFSYYKLYAVSMALIHAICGKEISRVENFLQEYWQKNAGMGVVFLKKSLLL